MNVLIGIEMEDSDKARVRAVSDDVQLLEYGSAGEALESMPEVDAVLGGVSREMFLRGERLRWVQITSAGADDPLFPEFVESDVILTSAKGTVGVPPGGARDGAAPGAHQGHRTGHQKAELGPASAHPGCVLGAGR